MYAVIQRSSDLKFDVGEVRWDNHQDLNVIGDILFHDRNNALIFKELIERHGLNYARNLIDVFGDARPVEK